MYTILIILFTVLGGVITAILGYLDALKQSGDTWNWTKFWASVIRAAIATFATVPVSLISQGNPLIVSLLGALAAGGGTDALLNRLSGALGNPSFPLPKQTTTITQAGSSTPGTAPPTPLI